MGDVVGLTVRLLPVTVTPSIATELAFSTDQISVVLPPLVIVLFVAAKLRIEAVAVALDELQAVKSALSRVAVNASASADALRNDKKDM